MAKWNFEPVKAEALRFSSRAEFQRGSSSAYQRAIKMGWLDEVCEHMTAGVKGRSHLEATSQKEVWKEALKYETRGAFKKGSYWAYSLAQRNGWLDEVCKYMESGYKGRPSNWTLESVMEVAKQYKTRTEFQKEQLSAYRAATKNGWLDTVCEHMQLAYGSPIRWTLEAVQAEALKHERRNDFRKEACGAYARALKMGWIDDVCAHMVRGEKDNAEPDQEWTFESIEAEALRYSSRSDFYKAAHLAYSEAERKGWLDEVCGHMGPAGQRVPRKSYAEIEAEALRYHTRSEFKQGSLEAYRRAETAGWLDEICEHMLN